jgi:hypothetical protein
MKSFSSLLYERREMRDSKKCEKLGLGSNPGLLALKACVLPKRHFTSHELKQGWIELMKQNKHPK